MVILKGSYVVTTYFCLLTEISQRKSFEDETRFLQFRAAHAFKIFSVLLTAQRPLNTWTGRLLGFLQLLNYQRIQKVIVTSFVHLQKIHIFKKFGGRS